MTIVDEILKNSQKRFKKLGSHIVWDSFTDLIWERNPSRKTMTWEEALNYCKNLSLGGYDGYDGYGWRIPTIQELQLIVDYTRYNPAIDPIFLGMSFSYWTNTIFIGYVDTIKKTTRHSPWIVNFRDGSSYNVLNSYKFYVRAVRGEIMKNKWGKNG